MNKVKNQDSGFRMIDFFMLGFGAMIGVGWTVSLNDWFQVSGGVIGTILAFIIGTLAIIPIGLCYGEMTGALPVSGGSMVFAYRAQGSRLSFISGWIVALAYIVLLPWEIIYINKILSILFPILQSGTPLYVFLGNPIYPLSLLSGIVITCILTFLNIKGSEMSGKLQTRLTMTIITIALTLIFFLLIKADFNNISPIYSTIKGYNHGSFFEGFISILVIVPFFLAGFDAIPQAIEDAQGDIESKAISKIIVFTIIAAGLFYVAIILSSGLATNWQEFSQLDTPPLAFMFRNVYSGVLGKGLYYLTLIGALAGLLSTWNGMFIAASRLLFSMGRAKLLPSAFGKSSKYGTPITAILFCSLATLLGVFLGMPVIKPLTNVGSTAFVLGWLITSYSTFALRKYEPELIRPIYAGKGFTVIYLAIGISSILILLSIIPASPGFMGFESLIILLGWIVLGGLFYFISKNTGETISEKRRHRLIFGELYKKIIHREKGKNK